MGSMSEDWKHPFVNLWTFVNSELVRTSRFYHLIYCNSFPVFILIHKSYIIHMGVNEFKLIFSGGLVLWLFWKCKAKKQSNSWLMELQWATVHVHKKENSAVNLRVIFSFHFHFISDFPGPSSVKHCVLLVQLLVLFILQKHSYTATFVLPYWS